MIDGVNIIYFYKYTYGLLNYLITFYPFDRNSECVNPC